MCGILGAYTTKRDFFDRVCRHGSTALKKLEHRGPDSIDYRFFGWKNNSSSTVRRTGGDFNENNLFLGHTRLSIFDLSDLGKQPMPNHDETIWISYNGEIYNFIELRKELEGFGYKFKTTTDTEVLLYLYQHYGTDFIEKVHGIFAFSLFDRISNTIFLFRDHLGVKPLYYSFQENLLIFSSEIKGILSFDLVPREMDEQSIYHFFTFLFIPNPRTSFKGIQQLPPGHFLQFDTTQKSFEIRRYWQAEENNEIVDMSEGMIKQQLRDTIFSIVEQQIRSDVPFGSFLSGGIDSTIVTGAMKQCSDDIRTYTVGFDKEKYPHYDESEPASLISNHLGTKHQELTVNLDQPELLFDLLDFFDQPFGNPTYLIMYLISKEAKNHITVALCGAGGDELFAGYPRHKTLLLNKYKTLVSDSVLKFSGALLKNFKDDFANRKIHRMKRFLSGCDSNPVQQFLNYTFFLNDAEKQSLLPRRGTETFSSLNLYNQKYVDSNFQDPVNKYLALETKTFLSDNLLEYTDKMSMANGLEMRVPLLDHELVNFALNIPSKMKISFRDAKIILKESFPEFFPSGIEKLPKKGFNVPLAHWMRNEFQFYFGGKQQLRREDTRDINPGLTWKNGIINQSEVEKFNQQHLSGQCDRSYELFAVMVFDIWYQKYISR